MPDTARPSALPEGDVAASTPSAVSGNASRWSPCVALDSSAVRRVSKTPVGVVPLSAAVASGNVGSALVAKKGKRSWALNVVVLTVATGIIATMSIPAFALNPDSAHSDAFGPSPADNMVKAQPQSVEVGAFDASAVSRDVATATSEQQLAEQRAAEAARQRAAESLGSYASGYTGPSVSDLLANPQYPNFSLSQVFSVAQQYIGTRYMYGGSTPAGFDCSGYVMYVYAQFGISLPHSVSGQAAQGTRISISDAQPGDLIVMPGHIGFYAGGGNILDAPESGRSVSVRPIWTSDYSVVRLGI